MTPEELDEMEGVLRRHPKVEQFAFHRKKLEELFAAARAAPDGWQANESALARAHAEGLEAGLRQAALHIQGKPSVFALNWAESIRSLIPAAPEVIK